jgi:hypothetical protein
MKGTLLSRPKKLYSPFHPSHSSGVTEIRHMATPAHALQVLHVRLKSVSNEGHFTPEARTVFLSYLPRLCSGVTEICYMALPAHALEAVQVRLKSVSN